MSGIKDISNDQRELIAVTMNMCGVATDPAHMCVMTNTFLSHVMGGLVGKYGYGLSGLDIDINKRLNDCFATIEENGTEYFVFAGTRDLVPEDNIPYMIENAYQMLQVSKFHWGTALPMLQRAQRELIKICVSEEMLDYKRACVSMMEEMKAIREMSGNEQVNEPTEKPFTV
jgi:hypothetical protein